MPSTPIHDFSSVSLGVVIGALAIALKQPIILATAAGAMMGVMFSPDWDWDGTVIEDKKSRRRQVLTEARAGRGERNVKRVFGKVVRRWPPIIEQWLYLYAIIFSHRGLSHSYLVGTLTRILWLFFLYLIAGALLYAANWLVLLPLFILGQWLADALHVTLDFL
jgi:uncharacterized metal-binding protein